VALLGRSNVAKTAIHGASNPLDQPRPARCAAFMPPQRGKNRDSWRLQPSRHPRPARCAAFMPPHRGETRDSRHLQHPRQPTPARHATFRSLQLNAPRDSSESQCSCTTLGLAAYPPQNRSTGVRPSSAAERWNAPNALLITPTDMPPSTSTSDPPNLGDACQISMRTASILPRRLPDFFIPTGSRPLAQGLPRSGQPG